LFQLPQSDLSDNVTLFSYSDFVRKIVLVKPLRRKEKKDAEEEGMKK
jgi:hypothetical protein